MRVESHASEKKRLTSWAAWQQAKSGLQSFFSLMIREDVAHDGGDQVLSQLPALDDQKGLRNVGDHAATLQELRESFLLLLPLWAKATQDAARLSNMLAIAGEAYVLHTLAELVGAPRLAHIARRLRTASTIYAPSYAPTTARAEPGTGPEPLGSHSGATREPRWTHAGHTPETLWRDSGDARAPRFASPA